ncbi:MAG TPA: single-stranded-DNA-specific exonuclease RecJ [Gemmatimonadaceae bacterium]|nr:single-stranded-DNA-specific exonuclease RecJ [Gemmatimonadaceae bacterium]
MTAPAARARPKHRWILPERPDPAAVSRLQEELHLPEPLCRLLAARGLAEIDGAKLYLRPRLDHLHDPCLMLDLDRAADRLGLAIDRGEKILIHGDYDVDGMCSTTLMTRTLRMLGASVVPFIPRRIEDGYDLGAAGVDAALRAGVGVVVTCDCGTSAHEPVRALQSAGIDVIISDHHLPSGGQLPAAFAILNPKRPGCTSPDRDLAAVGVAFKLALALVRKRGGNENAVYGMLDLVALATIADIAPLRGENRVLARYGLKMLNETQNIGLRALIRAAGLADRPITAGRVGFILAPRLNAVGRLGHAIRGVELLLCTDEHRANALARDFEELNERRQEVDRATLVRARELMSGADLDETYGIVLAEEGWHPGVIGIVASRIVEEFGRPTVLVALEGDVGKGSGRSISAFDLHAGLSGCRELLMRFGGHRSAAGITIARHQLPAFAERFNAIARERLTPEDLVPELRADLDVTLGELTLQLEALLRHVEPCGVGNPSPVLVARNLTVAAAPRVVGREHEHLKLWLADAAGAHIEALGWGMAHRATEVEVGSTIDVAFRLESDEWNGEKRLQARLADFRG